jgi:hypothetical protein
MTCWEYILRIVEDGVFFSEPLVNAKVEDKDENTEE